MNLYRLLSAGSSDDEEEEDNAIFNVAIATIFAREVLEGAIIIGQYRTAVFKSECMDEERKSVALRAITKSSLIASFVAVLVVIAVAVPLGILSEDLDEKVVEIIEGISKVIASICIVQLSVKLPVWLGLYKKVSIFPWKTYDPAKAKNVDNLTLKEIHFNVSWNIWREVAECGVFLIPFFLGTGAKAIPLSAFVGVIVSVILGIGIYFANNRMENKFWLAFFMSGLTLFLAVGLFVGGCHEFEEVWGMTKNVWKIENSFWNHKEFPMVLLKPFGWSSSRSVLQITTFWLFLSVGLGYHYLKYRATQRVRALYPEEEERPALENNKKYAGGTEANEPSKLEKGESSSDSNSVKEETEVNDA